MSTRVLAATSLLFALAACTGSPGTPRDGGDPDSGVQDTDSGAADDSGTTDDSGTSDDSGTTDDSGTSDDSGGGEDSGSTDESFPVELSPALTLLDRRPTNLVVISVDTLRRDRINHLGYDVRTITPQIDALYSEGVGLEDHRSCSSWTLPSFLCALTGQDLLSLGWWPANNDGLPPATPDEITLMAEYFQAEGFYTLLWGASGFLGETVDMDQGYAAGQSTFGSSEQQEIGGIRAKELVTGALSAMDERPSDQPLMMHLHFIDPHMPYVATDDLLTELGIDELQPTDYDYSTESGTLIAWTRFERMTETAQQAQLDHMNLRYDAEIKLVDQQITRFLSSGQFDAIRDDTLVVFFSDHGEEFQEHGNFNHGYNLYEHQLRVPAALWWPDHLAPAAVDSPTQHEDLLPTILALFDLESPGLTGRILGAEPLRERSYHDLYRGEASQQAVNDGQHKLVFRWPSDGSTEAVPLYFDLDIDRGETENRYQDDDPDVIRLWDALAPRVEIMQAGETSD